MGCATKVQAVVIPTTDNSQWTMFASSTLEDAVHLQIGAGLLNAINFVTGFLHVYLLL